MKATTSVIIVTIFLTIYTILFSIGLYINVLSCLFLISPIILIGMVYTVLKEDSKEYSELGENEEWGYRDKKREHLGMF